VYTSFAVTVRVEDLCYNIDMETTTTIPWIELIRLADEADEATYTESDERVEGRVRLGESWYIARSQVPLTPRLPRWRLDEAGFAYRCTNQGRDYPNLNLTSWAQALAVEAMRAEIVAVLRTMPAHLDEEYSSVAAAFRHVSLIDSSALDELDPALCDAVSLLQQQGVDPQDEDEIRWKLYLQRVRQAPRYAELVAESQQQRARSLQLDRTTFLAELEARGFHRSA
jgi:hypothetical protein